MKKSNTPTQWFRPDGSEHTRSVGAFGFIYLVLDLQTGMFYIGKKQYEHRRRLKPLAGQKRHRIQYVESDWRTYKSSSPSLLTEISIRGAEDFVFVVIAECFDKSSLHYQEIYELVIRDAIRSDRYYNLSLPACKFVPKNNCVSYL